MWEFASKKILENNMVCLFLAYEQFDSANIFPVEHPPKPLFMEEILHHLGCIKPVKQWDILPTSTGADFFHQQCYPSFGLFLLLVELFQFFFK